MKCQKETLFVLNDDGSKLITGYKFSLTAWSVEGCELRDPDEIPEWPGVEYDRNNPESLYCIENQIDENNYIGSNGFGATLQASLDYIGETINSDTTPEQYPSYVMASLGCFMSSIDIRLNRNGDSTNEIAFNYTSRSGGSKEGRDLLLRCDYRGANGEGLEDFWEEMRWDYENDKWYPPVREHNTEAGNSVLKPEYDFTNARLLCTINDDYGSGTCEIACHHDNLGKTSTITAEILIKYVRK